MRALVQAIDQDDLRATTSQLTLAEVLVKPIKDGNLVQQEVYENMLRGNAHLRVPPITRDILVQAAQKRATTQLKLPDALHAVTAELTGCTTFITNDAQFKGRVRIPVVVLHEL